MSMWTKGFWKGTAERVIMSTAGGALTAIGNEAFDILDNVDAGQIMGLALGAGLLSLLKALATGAVNGSPSVGSAETPSESVVEKVSKDGLVVSGKANERTLREGTFIRSRDGQ